MTNNKVKFIAYVNETDYGCDYTVACGKVLWELKAETYESAIIELRKRIVPELEGIDDGGYELNSVILYEVKDLFDVSIDDWYAELARQKEDYRTAQMRKKEHEEYERLKMKFENG